MSSQLFPAFLFAAAAIYSCGDGGEEAPLAPGGEGEGQGPARDSGSPAISGFTIPDELSPSGVHSPFTGSGLEGNLFPAGRLGTGGPGRDGIPAVTNPNWVGPADVSYVQEDDLVLGLVIDGVPRAYPENIGWWHEIINDEIGDFSVSVTLCPLTGTGLAFKMANESRVDLGVSGLLYNSNLVMYDRRDNETLYPQMYFTGISGPREGESLTMLPITETTWRTWKRLYPDTEVLALGNGTYTYRNENVYVSYPYPNYRETEILLFAPTPSTHRNPNPYALNYSRKSPLLGVRLNGEPKAYVFEDMGDRIVINDRLGGRDIVVVWDREAYLARAYWRDVDGRSLTFEMEPDAGFPFSLIDDETGSRWDIKGVATEGPMAGAGLAQVPAHNSYWFAWVTFWQETDLWKP